MSERLAILGGRAAFQEARHVGSPNLPDRHVLHGRIDAILDARRLSNDGPFVREFEARLARMTGARHAVAMCNATLAMQVLYRALGLSGEVIMPSFTFIATAHAAAWEGLVPVFVDVESETHTLDPERVRAAITERTAAIMGVHLWGRCCNVDALQAIADQAGVPLLFDAAHAIGCTWKDRPVGSLGRASVLSFHATKVVQSLEGGAVLTCDDGLAARLRLMRNFGFEGYDDVSALGTNAKLNEVAAAFGIGGLEQFDQIVERNRMNLRTYQAALEQIPGLSFHRSDLSQESNWQYVIVRIDPACSPLSRDELVEVLHAENILARKYFTPGCHRMAPYRERFDSGAARLPVTEKLARELIALPTGTGVSLDDIVEIAARLRSGMENADRVREAIAARGSESRNRLSGFGSCNPVQKPPENLRASSDSSASVSGRSPCD